MSFYRSALNGMGIQPVSVLQHAVLKQRTAWECRSNGDTCMEGATG